jgi:hypothetical protein
VERLGRKINVYRSFVEKPEDISLRGTSRRRWRTILKCIQRKGCVDVNYIYLSEDRDSWRAVVNKVMNIWVR